MSPRGLRLLAVAIPVILMLAWEWCRASLLEPLLSSGGEHLVAGAATVVGTLGYSVAVLAVIERKQQRVVEQNRQLCALNAEAESLYGVAQEVLSSLDTDRILQSVVEHARSLLGADAGCLCLLDARVGGTAVVRAVGPAGCLHRDAPPARETGAKRDVSTCRQDEQVTRPRPPCLVLGQASFQQHVASVRAGDNLAGELCLASSTARQFSQHELELLGALANQAAIALRNARLYEKAQYTAVLEERERIAREMHDSLAQVLGYLHMKARALKESLSPGDLTTAHEQLDEMASVAEEAYVDVREAILGLRETMAPGAGLAGVLSQYLEKFARQSGIKTKLILKDGAAPSFLPAVEVQLVRIIQEALTNVRKHSGARHAWVRFEAWDGLARISVEDDGSGFDLSQLSRSASQRFGLHTMAERAEQVGGKLEIHASPGKGTRVTVLLPTALEEAIHGTHQSPARGRSSPVSQRAPGAARLKGRRAGGRRSRRRGRSGS